MIKEDAMIQSPVAHTPPGGTHWHALSDHLHAISLRVETFARAPGMPALAYTAGLLHDLGKAAPSFLVDCAAVVAAGSSICPRYIDHKTAGALAVAEHCPLLAFAIIGHHGGLLDRPTVMNSLQHVVQNDHLQD